jgi:hypothetical protein
MNNLENVKKVIEAAIAGDMNLNLDPKLVLAVVDECLAGRRMIKSGRKVILRGQVIPDTALEPYLNATERTDKMLGSAG